MSPRGGNAHRALDVSVFERSQPRRPAGPAIPARRIGRPCLLVEGSLVGLEPGVEVADAPRIVVPDRPCSREASPSRSDLENSPIEVVWQLDTTDSSAEEAIKAAKSSARAAVVKADLPRIKGAKVERVVASAAAVTLVYEKGRRHRFPLEGSRAPHEASRWWFEED